MRRTEKTAYSWQGNQARAHRAPELLPGILCDAWRAALALGRTSTANTLSASGDAVPGKTLCRAGRRDTHAERADDAPDQDEARYARAAPYRFGSPSLPLWMLCMQQV